MRHALQRSWMPATPDSDAAQRSHRPQSVEGCRRSSRCQQCTVRQSALFGALTTAELDDIAWRVPDQTIAAGQVLYKTGDDPAALFIIRSGLIKLETYLPDGTYRIVRLARRADILALEGLLGSPCDHTAIALADAEVCKVPWPVVRQVMDRQPGLSTQMIRHWHQAVQKADGWLTHYSLGAARQRVARFLVDLGDVSGGVATAVTAPPPSSVIAIPSRDDVGAILGITKETASRLIAEFQRSGVVVKLDQQRAKIDREALLTIGGEACP